MDTIGTYKIQQQVLGGICEVYQAYDPAKRCTVLLKRLTPEQARDQELVQRFRKEAQILKSVHSDYVVRFYDDGEWQGRAFLATEFLRGKDLRQRLERDGKIPEPELVRILHDAARGLAALHQKHVFHRDVKPANLFVQDAGPTKVLDLGIARLRDSDLTQPGTQLGTPLYMSPEQWQGVQADGRADIYSLGLVAYHAVTGKKPHGEGATRDQVCYRTISRDFQPEWPDGVSPGLRRLVEDCTRRDRDARPPSMEAVIARLQPTNRSAAPGGLVRSALASALAIAALLLTAGSLYRACPPSVPTAPTPGTIRLNPPDKLEYVWVPPGTALLGTVEGERTPGDAMEREQRFPQGFWIGRTEVPQYAFEKLLGRQRNQSHFRGPYLPVESVTWNTAQQYCAAAGGRLPFAEEFEYAARAGSRADRYGPLDSTAWFLENSGAQTHPVGTGKLPNPWGLSDMLGNVWEWTNTVHKPESYYYRGGSFRNAPINVRAATLFAGNRETTERDLGFRCLLPPQ